MTDSPFTLLDAAYVLTPQPVSVSRVHLHAWVGSGAVTLPGLADTIAASLDVLTQEFPSVSHGLLIEGTQRRAGHTPERPRPATLHNYASRFLQLPQYTMETFSDDDTGPARVMIIQAAPGHRKTPRWVWHHLAGTLLLKAQVARPY